MAVVFSLQAFASNEGKPRSFKKIESLSSVQLNEALTEYVGYQDTWRTDTNLLTKVSKYNPFRAKPSQQQEIDSLHKLNQSPNPNALQAMAVLLTRSPHNVQNSFLMIQGEKRLVMQNYLDEKRMGANRFSYNSNLPAYHRGSLFFFENLEYGKIESQNKSNLSRFAMVFDHIAMDLRRAYEAAVKHNVPVLIEFESSALQKQAPLTTLLFETILRNADQHPGLKIRIEATRDNGRLVLLPTEYAKGVVENVQFFANEFKKYIRMLRDSAFTDKAEATRDMERIVDLLKNGNGLSSIFYTEERIKERELSVSTGAAPACHGLFSRFIGKK